MYFMMVIAPVLLVGGVLFAFGYFFYHAIYLPDQKDHEDRLKRYPHLFDENGKLKD